MPEEVSRIRTDQSVDVCASCIFDVPNYTSIIGTVPHCCDNHWHCKPGGSAVDYIRKSSK